MVISCSSYGCTNRWTKDKKIQFHRFPLENPQRSNQWITAMRRISWIPSKYSYICSEHFTADSYKTAAKRYLKNDAVPSIFNFPAHLQKKITERRKIVKHSLVKPVPIQD